MIGARSTQTEEPVLRPGLETDTCTGRGGNGSNGWALSNAAQKKRQSHKKRGPSIDPWAAPTFKGWRKLRNGQRAGGNTRKTGPLSKLKESPNADV